MNEREELRGQILEVAYEEALKAGGTSQGYFMTREVAKLIGAEFNEVRNAVTSLKASGLVEVETVFGGGDELLHITDFGFQSVERLRDEGYEPDAPEGSPSGIMYVTFNGDVYGQATVQGSGSTVNISQRSEVDPEALALIGRILDTTEKIQDEHLQARARETFEALERELRSEQPDERTIRTLVQGAYWIAEKAGVLLGLTNELATVLNVPGLTR